MTFNDMEYGFQEAFLAAWSAYKRGSMPIGCAIINSRGEVVARGENSIFAQDSKEPVNAHRLAHAELNAILKVNNDNHPDIDSYTMYVTMEPCAMCYGAIVQGNFKRVKYAMKDNYRGGASAINEKVELFRGLNIEVSGPFRELEVLAIAFIVYRRLCYAFAHNYRSFADYAGYCPQGFELGHVLYADDAFNKMIADDAAPQQVFDYILARIE